MLNCLLYYYHIKKNIILQNYKELYFFIKSYKYDNISILLYLLYINIPIIIPLIKKNIDDIDIVTILYTKYKNKIPIMIYIILLISI